MGARTAAPGGGSVSALLAALGAGLGSMVIGDGDQHFTRKVICWIFIKTGLFGDGNHNATELEEGRNQRPKYLP